jgi:hypothetical protein
MILSKKVIISRLNCVVNISKSRMNIREIEWDVYIICERSKTSMALS